MRRGAARRRGGVGTSSSASADRHAAYSLAAKRWSILVRNSSSAARSARRASAAPAASTACEGAGAWAVWFWGEGGRRGWRSVSGVRLEVCFRGAHLHHAGEHERDLFADERVALGGEQRLVGGTGLLRRGSRPPPLPPPSRTNWTRLVPPSVLIGHVSTRLGSRSDHPAETLLHRAGAGRYLRLLHLRCAHLEELRAIIATRGLLAPGRVGASFRGEAWGWEMGAWGR